MPVAPIGPSPVAAPVTQRVSIGELLGGRYRVDQRIGVGGMAEVFRAHDIVLGRNVAIKLFRGDGELPEGSNGEQRRGAELQALAQLSHPNLITLYDGMVNPKAPGEHAYLVMELITGPNLAGRLSTGPLSELEARAIGGQIADALSYVHARGMVHRDVKPANILLGQDASGEDSQPRPRLSDFGIVRLLGSEHVTTANMFVGTASYLAPEQARGDEVGPAADVYALGLVLLEGLTGTKCFEGSALEVAMARLSRSPEIPPELPEPWPGLLAAMTAMEPEHRPRASQVAELLRGTSDTSVLSAAVPFAEGGAQQSASAMTSAFAPGWLAADAAAPPAEDDYPSPAPQRRAGRRAAVIGLLVAALAALAAGTYLLAQSPTKHLPTAPVTTPSISHQAPATHTSAPPPTSSAPTSSRAPSSSPTPSSSAPATTAPATSSAVPSTSAAPTASSSAGTSSTAAATGTAATGSTSPAAAASGTATSTTSASPSA